MASDHEGDPKTDKDKPFSIAQSFLQSGVKHKGVALPWSCTPQNMAAIEAMEIREDDVILATYQKCGTHWMAEIIILVQCGGKQPDLASRFERMSLLLELPNPGLPECGMKTGCEVAPDWSSPRLIATHLPLQFLPTQIWEKKPKIVYVSRDPRDALTSQYSFMSHDPQAPSYDIMLDMFCSEKASNGTIWDHAHGYWEHRNDDNFFYARFEDMKKDPAGCVAKVAAYLGYDLSDEQLNEVVKHSSLPEMKATYARMEEELGPPGKFVTHAAGILPFLHKGVVGGWKTLFTVAQNERFQKYHEEQLKKFGDGFSF